MAKICEVHLVDNGLLVQTSATEDRDGIFIATTVGEAVGMVDDIVQTRVAARMGSDTMKDPQPEQPTLPSGAPLPPGVPPPTGASEQQQSAEVIEFPDVFGSPAYEAEMQRMVADNDRAAIKKRLDAHVAAGVLEGYNDRCKAPSLVDTLRETDKKVAVANAAPPVAEQPPQTEGNPVTTQGDDLFNPGAAAPEVTVADVSAALSAAAQKGEGQRAAAVAILHKHNAQTVSQLTPDTYPAVIAEANAIV